MLHPVAPAERRKVRRRLGTQVPLGPVGLEAVAGLRWPRISVIRLVVYRASFHPATGVTGFKGTNKPGVGP
ncbi:MAG: hypothetical protein ACRDQZ_25810 [Mycobacteriales bacterium]